MINQQGPHFLKPAKLNTPHKFSLFTPADYGDKGPPAVGVEKWWTICGFDLGQVRDPSAVCVISRKVYNSAFQGPRDERWWMSCCKNLPLGMDYVEQAKRVLAIGADILAFDVTGGRIMADLLRREAMASHYKGRIRPISIASSVMREAAIREKGFWSVPKRELVAAINIAVQDRKVLPFPEAEADYRALLEQCRNFQEKTTAAGNKKMEAPGHGVDDLVIAASLATWWALRFGGRSEPAILC